MEILGFELPVFLLLVPLASLLLYVYGTWNFGYWKSRGVPGPPPTPFFGNTRSMVYKGFVQSLWAFSKQYGRIYGIYSGQKPMLVINDLDILKEVFVKDFHHFTDRFERNNLSAREIQKGLFFARGSDWRRIRNIVTPTFSAGKLKLMEYYINRCSTDLATNIEEISQTGGLVDAKEYFGAYTMDAIAGTAFGLVVNSQKDLSEPFVTNAKKIMTGGGRLSILGVILILVPRLAPVLHFLKRKFFMEETVQFFLQSIYRMMEERKQDQLNQRKPDFLQLLLNAEATEDFPLTTGSEKRLTKEEIAGQAFIFFVAGYETTSTALQYLFYNLAKFPELQERIVDEIENIVGDRTPTYDDVGKLKLLEQTIYETLRLYPPVSVITRVASETVTINGLKIEKGTGVMIPICDISRDPEYFPDPLDFKPERFSDSNKGEMNPVSFLPFGFGPRLCVGMRLALLEVKMAAVHVLRKVRCVWTDDLPSSPYPSQMSWSRAGTLVTDHCKTICQSSMSLRHRSEGGADLPHMELLFGTDVPLYILLLAVVCILLCIYGTWPFGLWKSLGIDGPNPEAFFGNQRELNREGNQTCFRKWTQRYGRTFGIYSGRQPLLVTSDLDILKEVLVKKFSKFTDRFVVNDINAEVNRVHLINAKGAQWRRIRKLLTSAFTTSKLRQFEPWINRCCTDLVANFEGMIRKDERIDVKKLFGGFSMDVIARTAFGIEVNSQKDFDEPLVRDAKIALDNMNTGTPFLVIRILFPFLAPVLKLLRTYFLKITAIHSLVRNIEGIIESRKKAKSEQKQADFLQMILTYERSEDGEQPHVEQKSMSRLEILGQAFLFFVAAYETTSSTLQFMAYCLARHPDIQQKILQEIEIELSDENPSYDKMAKLKYLDAAIHETLRMFPPINTVNRLASETVTIKGVTIPAGGGVIVPIIQVLQDPEYFPEPDKFIPERFLTENKANINPISYLAFGFGPRLCIGRRLALLEVKMAMVHVLRKMQFVKTDDLPDTLNFKSGTSLSPTEKPLMVKAVLRKSAVLD
ncbi:uncharacterized protein LOC112576449 [Pomacea canaliculata]|uniref:uncharacterized protein LOC112576449 n=1 Tax=Pomacea canaliculata TaxID=400727 RepID=UPI000D7264A4|nr:uncharacterized protein LOC112576449 [Pomacea canaliculata]